MKLTTTFNELRKAGLRQLGYTKLARYLGGIKKYGADTPIDILTILDSNGLDDCVWVVGALLPKKKRPKLWAMLVHAEVTVTQRAPLPLIWSSFIPALPFEWEAVIRKIFKQDQLK